MANYVQNSVKPSDNPVNIAKVPLNNFGKLKYYLSCVNDTIEASREIAAFTDFSEFTKLTLQDKRSILEKCMLFRPEEFVGKCWFYDENMETGNRFFKIEDMQNSTYMKNISIGSNIYLVHSIMYLERSWLRRNYYIPLAKANREIQEAGNS